MSLKDAKGQVIMKRNSALAILKKINQQLEKTSSKDYSIIVEVKPEQLNFAKLKLLYFLLNNFDNQYFIIIKGVPFCLMPTAKEHLIYKKESSGNYRKDKICQACDFSSGCPGWSKKFLKVSRSKIKPVKDLPKEIVFELTTKCNLNCIMCTKSKKETTLSLKKVKKVLKEAKKIGIKAVRFTGGEPLLEPNLYKYLKYAKEEGFYVILNTNLGLFKREDKDRLCTYVDNILVSLHGYNQLIDKKIQRANANFIKKIQDIYLLSKYIPVVRVGTVITKTLINNFKKYYQLIEKLNVTLWELYRPMVIKNSLTDKELNIDKADLIKLIESIHQTKKKSSGIPVKIANPIPFCITKKPEQNANILIGAVADDGHSRIVFDAKGFFKPSYFITKNLGTTIKKAWDNPWLKKIRGFYGLPQKCKSCSYLKWCCGGSRVHAYLYYGNYFKADPLMDNSYYRAEAAERSISL